jgi:hypothetical protein
MHQYDEPYDDYDDYDDAYDYGSESNHNKFYFKFDVNPYGSLSDWFKKMIEDLINYKTPLLPEGFSPVSFPVNDYFSNTVSGDNPLLYLGNNHYNEPMWKKKDFIQDKLGTEYVLHLQSNAGYFISQPRYYKALFDILN